MDAVRQEFWGDLQVDLYVQNTAFYLANQSLESVITDKGYKAHKPILSHPAIGTYTPGSDISFSSKSATKQTLTVDTFKYAADEIDITVEKQNPYPLDSHSLTSIRRGLMNVAEQVYLDEIANAAQSISGSPVLVSTTNIQDIFEEAEGKLGAFDVPNDTNMRAVVFGPRTIAKLRTSKAERETGLGDTVSANGVIGPWRGWTIVQNNNLPYSAVLSLATNPTDGDTVTVAGVTFQFKTTITSATTGYVGVLLDSTVDLTRAALAAAINDSGTAGTTYVQLSAVNDFIIRRKRNVTATNNNSADTLTIAGYGDIAVSSDLTDGTDAWGSQTQNSIFMMRGAIDFVMQFLDLEVGSKEKGFAKLPKGIIGLGAKTFDDGSRLMVDMTQNVAAF